MDVLKEKSVSKKHPIVEGKVLVGKDLIVF
jgi:hypothetical protein